MPATDHEFVIVPPHAPHPPPNVKLGAARYLCSRTIRLYVCTSVRLYAMRPTLIPDIQPARLGRGVVGFLNPDKFPPDLHRTGAPLPPPRTRTQGSTPYRRILVPRRTSSPFFISFDNLFNLLSLFLANSIFFNSVQSAFLFHSPLLASLVTREVFFFFF
jgi:hypothetical protein